MRRYVAPARGIDGVAVLRRDCIKILDIFMQSSRYGSVSVFDASYDDG